MSKRHHSKYEAKKNQKSMFLGRGYIHGCRVRVHVSKWLFTRQLFKRLGQIGYIHGCRVSASNCYIHGSRSRANLDIYTAAVCPHEMVIYTAAVPKPNRLYTRQPGVSTKLLYTRQPFQSKFRYIHDCRVST